LIYFPENEAQEPTMKRLWNLPKVDLMPLSEISEKRPVALVYSGPAWQAVESKLHLSVVWKAEVFEATIESWEHMTQGFQGEVVYSVGGGLTADAAKYIAVKFGLPLVVIPTALSVDAFITSASGIRRDGCVNYIETKPPEELILDLDVIAAAPPAIRAAGVTDVISIATGSWDWKFAHERGRNPAGMEFIPWVYENAQSILHGVLDCAEAAGRGDRAGLKCLYDCLAMEVQLCNQVGHARPEEGSEHYFAYCAEQLIGPGWPHGDLVGPGILLMAERQGQDTHCYKAALRACNIPLDRIASETIRETFAQLPGYCEKHGLAFGLAHTL
jgi:glycerol-1-phosphate dehydrogenase [NAD(P)+]